MRPASSSRRAASRSLAAALLLAVAGCGGSEASGPAVEVLTVHPQVELVAEAGGERLFQARREDEDGRLQPVSDATWSSSDPEVAVSLGGGRFLAVAAGTITVTAEVDGLQATASLEVYLAEPVAAWEPGQTYSGRRDYIRYRPGTLPVVLSAGHGGRLEPTEMADRGYGVVVTDLETLDLAERIRDALEARLGHAPHLVVSQLRRTKLDPNRDVIEAAQGDPLAEHAWREYHAFLDTARALVTRDHGAGLYLDVHGHGHPVARVELGYLLDDDALSLPDSMLAAPRYAEESSVRALVAASGASLSEVVRGPESLGSLLEARGVAAVPSPGAPGPGGEPYFTGGYSTLRHGSRDGGTISGIQLEHHYPGLRDSEANRQDYAERLASAVETYLARWYPDMGRSSLREERR